MSTRQIAVGAFSVVFVFAMVFPASAQNSVSVPNFTFPSNINPNSTDSMTNTVTVSTADDGVTREVRHGSTTQTGGVDTSITLTIQNVTEIDAGGNPQGNLEIWSNGGSSNDNMAIYTNIAPNTTDGTFDIDMHADVGWVEADTYSFEVTLELWDETQ